MALINAYPEKPIVPYKKTVVEMALVIKYLQSLVVNKEVKRMSYIIFRNEGANGKSGINFNFCGFQADSGRWGKEHDDSIIGVVRKVENGTGKERLFLAFKDVGGCLSMLVERVEGRGLSVGGTTKKIWKNHLVKDATDLATAYQREWVKGSVTATPTQSELNNFLSMYKQAEKLFN